MKKYILIIILLLLSSVVFSQAQVVDGIGYKEANASKKAILVSFDSTKRWQVFDELNNRWEYWDGDSWEVLGATPDLSGYAQLSASNLFTGANNQFQDIQVGDYLFDWTSAGQQLHVSGANIFTISGINPGSPTITPQLTVDGNGISVNSQNKLTTNRAYFKTNLLTVQSYYRLPDINSLPGDTATLPVSVNGILADNTGNITISGGATQLSDLIDINTSTPTNRNALLADGVDWESRPIVEADISDFGSYATLNTEETITATKHFNDFIGLTTTTPGAGFGIQSNLTGSGSSYYGENSGTGQIIRFDINSVNGRGILLNGGTASTNDLLTIQNNSATTYFIKKEGNVNANSFVKIGSTLNDILTGNGTTKAFINDNTLASATSTNIASAGSLKAYVDAADTALILGNGASPDPEEYTTTGGETTWVLPNPITNSHQFFVNGLIQTVGVDYTWTGSTITYLTTITAGELHRYDSNVSAFNGSSAPVISGSWSMGAGISRYYYTKTPEYNTGSAFYQTSASNVPAFNLGGASGIGLPIIDNKTITSIKGTVIGSDPFSITLNFVKKHQEFITGDFSITAADPTLTSITYTFVAGDVGKTIRVVGAGVGGAVLTGTIASFTNTNEVELAAPADTTVSSANGALETNTLLYTSPSISVKAFAPTIIDISGISFDLPEGDRLIISNQDTSSGVKALVLDLKLYE